MNNIYLRMLDVKPAGSGLVLATVAYTEGSTPQKPGSSALFGRKGLIAGTVGGGVLEGQVSGIAQQAVDNRKSGYYHFNLDHDIFHEEEAICGGQASVLVDANPLDHFNVLEKMRKSLLDRIPGVLLTIVSGVSGDSLKISRFWVTAEDGETVRKIEVPGAWDRIRDILMKKDPRDYRYMEDANREKDRILLFDPVFPLPRLVIAGAGHIGKALAHLGSLLDFEVTVIDDREEYANRENLPDADHIIVKDIGEAVGETEKTADTFIVIVTRGHKDDAGALRSCIGTNTGYIGMIGSRGKVTQMKDNFITNGWATQQDWDKIFTPIGLEIESRSVQEIAVSIAAQLVLIRNKLKKGNA
jgi:xanthine dehydrogenase accessory factor